MNSEKAIELLRRDCSNLQETSNCGGKNCYDCHIDLAIRTIMKEVPEEVVIDGREWLCPDCGENLDFNNKMVGRCKCGKAVRWNGN